MLGILVVALIYAVGLTFLAPEPESLRAPKPSPLQNVSATKGTISLGLFLCAVFALTTRHSFPMVDEQWLALFAMSNEGIGQHSLLQIISSNFLHLDFHHLMSNLGALALASLYERRVGVGRYLTVFLTAAVVSSLWPLLVSTPVVSAGASGGIFGLAAAYFTDHEKMRRTDWLLALLAFVALATFLSVMNGGPASDRSYGIDYISHALGGIAGSLFGLVGRSRGANYARS